MKLSDTSLNSLRIALLEALPAAKLFRDGGVFISGFETLIAKQSIFTDNEKDILEKYLDDGGIRYCIEQYISNELFKDGYKGKSETTIGDYFGHEGMLNLTKRIAEYISSLPNTYVIITELPPELSKALRCTGLKIKLSDRISIVSEDRLPSEVFNSSLTFLSNDEINGFPGDQQIILPISERRDFDEQHIDPYSPIYFEYKCSGLITDDFSSKLFRDFYDELRAFYGIMNSVGLLGGVSYREPHKIQNSAYAFLNNLSSGVISSIESNPKDIIDASRSTVSAVTQEWLANAADKEKFFDPAVRIFSSNDLRLRTASVWMLRANQSTRPLDRLLEAAIVIEVLLGDRSTSDRIGLSKLMANRCAYALGKTVNEREQIIKDFDQFYNIRSQIVHTGRYQVSKADQDVIRKGVNLATRILRHEFNLLKPKS